MDADEQREDSHLIQHLNISKDDGKKYHSRFDVEHVLLHRCALAPSVDMCCTLIAVCHHFRR